MKEFFLQSACKDSIFSFPAEGAAGLVDPLRVPQRVPPTFPT